MTSVTSTTAVCRRPSPGATTSGHLVLAEGMTDTLVTFASGATEGQGVVVASWQQDAMGPLVVVDRTPFHPVDHTWPDQPGDRGQCGDSPVADTVMAARGPEGELTVGPAIPVKRGEPGWTWWVAHQLADGAVLPPAGAELALQVDAARRLRLSAAHTSCHLAALAMNRAAARLWRKEVRLDSVGSPDLDQLAMVSSVMDEEGSTDVYRFGKSLRKRGFDSAGFGEQLPEIVAEVRAQLVLWLSSAAPVRVNDGGDAHITARRRWTCALPDGVANIPCGGTHVASLAALAEVDVDYQVDQDGAGLTVRTTPRLAA